MVAAVKHVKLRNGVFQYVRRVPESVKQQPDQYEKLFNSRSHFRVSLKTKDQALALKRCYDVHMGFERKLASVGNEAPVSMTVQLEDAQWSAPRTVVQADLDALAERFKHMTVASMERAHIMADSSPQHAEEYERMLYDLELHAEDIVGARDTRGKGKGQYDTPADWADWVIQHDNLNAPLGSEAYSAIVGAIRAGIHQGHNALQATLQGGVVPQLQSSRSTNQGIFPTLAEAVEAYLKFKNLPVRTEVEVRSSLRLFEKLYGNKRLDALTRRDFQNYAEYLATQTIGGKTAGSVVRPASASTVKKRIGLIRAVINHAIDRDQFAGSNPASGINVDAYVAQPDRSIMPAKRRLTVDELNLLFQHPWFTGCASSTNTHVPGDHRLMGSEYWVPVVAALTGCRASELGGLALADVMLDGGYPHLLIRDNKYRRTKGGYARKVPILDALLDLGFAFYVDKIRKFGHDRLFPDWEPSKGKDSGRNDDKAWSNGKIIRAFNRTVVPTMLGARLVQGARQEVTFHSLRGAFKMMLSHSDYGLNQNIINEVIGHSKSELDKRYIGEIPIEETYPAVRGCYYKGLLIPACPTQS